MYEDKLDRMRPLTFLCMLFFTVGACADITSEAGSPEVQASLLGDLELSNEYVLMPTPSDILATRVPRFAGRYAEGNVVKIQIAGEPLSQEEEEKARREVRFVLDSVGQNDRPFEFVPGKYDFIQFRIWENRIRSVHQEFEVFAMGIQQKNQRLRVRVKTDEGKKKLLASLEILQIPHDAIHVEATSPPILYQTTQSSIRPVRGGTKVTIKYGPSSGATHICTNGFNVMGLHDNNVYVLVNAHCVVGSPYPFGGWVDNQRLNQPIELPLNSGRIARVTHNPPSSSMLPGCFPGHVCRYSDAAAARITLPSKDFDLYGIVRTMNRVVVPGVAGSININTSSPRISVVGVSFLNEGDTVDKIGQVTGWTAGPITSECEYIYVPLDNGGRVCSTVVEAGGYPGDSGAPVFLWDAVNNQARAVGLLFGGPLPGAAPASNEYFFSPENGIYHDFLPDFPAGFYFGP